MIVSHVYCKASVVLKGFSRCLNKVEAFAVFIQCVMNVPKSCGDWRILMEGAGLSLIAVLVVESKYAGCCACVDSVSCARDTVVIKDVVYTKCIWELFLVCFIS